MKKFILTMVFTGAIMISCDKKTNTLENPSATDTIALENEPFLDTEHTAQNSLDWFGTYEGILPCGDCPGIKTEVVLDSIGTFQYSSEYLDKNITDADSGEIMWHNNGSVVHLKGKNIDVKLRVIENALIQLDADGNEIDGALKNHYQLDKTN